MFSERMQQLRLSRGLNKRQTAQLLDIPYTTYNNYETGAREPGISMLLRIAGAFEVSVDYLIGHDIVLPVVDQKPDWAALWHSLSEDRQQDVYAFMEFKAYQQNIHANKTSLYDPPPTDDTITVAAWQGGVSQRPLSATRRQAIADQTRKLNRKQSQMRTDKERKQHMFLKKGKKNS